jgi:prepilin-type N-terminal cleavage/methylation domain-containing protein/prepilin-type processing-associated H-X9-DG protein
MNRRAFTLVELMVVISVIALMLAIVLPSMSSVYSVARATICRNNLLRIGEAFTVAGSGDAVGKGKGAGMAQVVDMYPDPMSWPAIPRNAVSDGSLFQCPEDEVKTGAVQDMFKLLEYANPYGRFPMNAVGGESFFFISRTGSDDRGPYTEYLLQDDNGNGQFAMMDFNGWIDTDGFVRVYHSGVLWVPDRVPNTPDFAGARGPGYPDRVNTCGDINAIYFRGQPAFGSQGMLRDHRGDYFDLPGWTPGFTNYAINSYAPDCSFGTRLVMLVDYKKEIIVEVDTPLEAEQILLNSGRHLGKVNYLRTDGSVRTAWPLELSPQLYPELWKPRYNPDE